MFQGTAIFYPRVSDTKQLENTSLDDQERMAASWWATKQINLLKVFREEGETAKFNDRPMLHSALAYCKEKPVDFFLVYKFDRLARSSANHHLIKTKLKENDVQLVSISEQCDDTPSGRLLENMLASIAQFDNEVRTERTVNGMKARVRQGLFPFSAPLGYELDIGNPGLKRPHPEYFELIKKGFQSIIYRGHRSNEVIQMLNQWNVLTSKGNKVSANQFGKMVQNKFYAGIVECMGLTVEGKHEAMISPDEWHKMQSVIIGHSNAKRIKHNTHNPDFPLNKTLVCTGCGKSMSGAWSKIKHVYGYYACRNGECRKKSKGTKAEIEKKFEGLLSKLRPSKTAIVTIRSFVTEIYTKSFGEMDKLKAHLKDEAKKLETRMENLEDMRLDGMIDKLRFVKKKEQLQSAISLNKIELAKLQSDMGSKEDCIAYSLNFLQQLPDFYFTLSPVEIHKLNTVLFPEGVCWENGGLRTPQLSPVFTTIEAVSRPSFTNGDLRGVFLELYKACEILHETVKEFKRI